MKALSIHPYYAMLIFNGEKTVEVRSWQTKFRGDFVVCSSKSPKEKGCISGHAMCIAHLDSIEPFKREHIKSACLDGMPDEPCYAWHLSNIRIIKPFQQKGKLNFFEVDDDKIELLCGDGTGETMTDEEVQKEIEKYIIPLLD